MKRKQNAAKSPFFPLLPFSQKQSKESMATALFLLFSFNFKLNYIKNPAGSRQDFFISETKKDRPKGGL
jgi:hypothetical protein